MKPFFVLVVVFIVCALLLKLVAGQVNYRLSAQIAMACMLVFTAIGHFAFAEGMSTMLPDFFPMKKELVLITGLVEIALGVGLVLPQYKYASAWMLIVFFILVLPINIRSAIGHINYQTGALDGPGISYLWFRVPLQLFFVLWVYFSTIFGK
ncbi:membrane protein [Muricauda sp. MAR_2010_75]|jgi:uncharacterized membrane protein|uniref:DoxX family protein n=1 Tax=Allomuricauda sp. MAR_2010_75 TaxID=1250232 RepID=UPI00056557E5|nr:membrane protein [Muricauda sp. MAR_2010_75]